MSIDDLAAKDPRFSSRVSSKISGDDDEDELAENGKGLVTGRVQEDLERPSWLGSSKKYYCVNCRKQIHNTPENDNRCIGKRCECRCRTHYIGKDGIARPYGTPDNSDERAKKQEFHPTEESEAQFEQIMAPYLATKKQNPAPQQQETRTI